jgi:Flavoprotein
MTTTACWPTPATPAGTQFVDADRLADLTGHPVRDDYKRPEDPDVLPFPPDAFVVAPATFNTINTINKWANGISDTLALGLLNEGLAAGQPIAAVPNPNITLAKHPAFVKEDRTDPPGQIANWVSDRTFPSGSANHATLSPAGVVQTPFSSWSMPS